jgi:signal transduction histidine kinase/DNA-binding response OmpR family regulator
VRVANHAPQGDDLSADVTDSDKSKVAMLTKRLARERNVRKQAELIAERSIRELYEREKDVKLLQKIALAANEATAIEHALQVAVDEVCAHTGWPVGHVYLRNEEGSPDLLPTRIWHLEHPGHFEAFRRITEVTPLPLGSGLPGRVLESGQPVWVVDVQQDSNFPRAKAATDIGVRGAVGFPILVGAEVVGVMEFFSADPQQPNQSLVDLMAHVGTQLGRVIERRRGEQTLKRARDLALEASHLKSAFLANMSHEIRTPMTAVIGFTGLLLDGALSPEQREFAEIVRSSAESLLDLINDILDLSKIEAGKLTIEPIPFDLEVAAGEALELLGSKAKEKGIDLILRHAPQVPRRVIGDPGRIRQVLTNLIGNAVKFTQAGHVLVDIESEQLGEGEGLFRFSVTDTGIGIPADKHDRLFQKFTQADATSTRQYGGTGLGLAISKQLVELMGGKIGLHSEPGQGSTFWFTLPLRLDREEQPLLTAGTELQNVRVLIVDDNELNRRVFSEQLARWNLRSTAVASGTEALRALRDAYVAGDPFQMGLLDFNVPGMDGETLARTIKSDRALEDIVLLLLTSAGQRGDAKRMSEAGFAAYLTKPVSPSLLLDALGAAWTTRALDQEAVLVTRHTIAEREALVARRSIVENATTFARVLLAEDNPVNQRLARLILEKMRCRVDTAANGREAVRMMREIPYDIVFMDCQMPEMDGYEATRQIRLRERGSAHVPIVALTAAASPAERAKCLQAGMNDHISKPIRREDIRHALERFVPALRALTSK